MQQRNANQRPFAVDLFAGSGGLSLGFEEAGFDVAASVEFDPVHAAVHSYNFPQTTMFCRDVRTMTGDEIRENSRIGSSEILVVFGGPPCQGISLMGKRNVEDPRNELLLEFARVVAELRPCYCVMENVAGLVVGKHRALLDGVVARLEKAGYSVLSPRVLQASEYGVPQSRRRLFLIGMRKDATPAAYPPPIVTARRIDGSSVVGELPLGPSVSEALFDIPNADNYEELLDSDEVTVRYGEPSAYAKRLRDVLSDADNYASPRVCADTLLSSSRRTNHSQTSIERFKATLPGTTESVSRFLRLHPDGISNTLRAGTASDRGAYTAPRPIHPLYPRVITVREAARLHGYPDWFRFHVTKWNGFREVGNSVPVFLGRAVASSVMKAANLTPVRAETVRTGDKSLLSFSQSEAEKYFEIEEKVIPARSR
ncbi:DNA (cytosine-5-)-methyltransferase [Gordonibacter sp. An230]|nr:DNA (cytosine-5-)-methyltransferase [Gordonibacter sp. An230]